MGKKESKILKVIVAVLVLVVILFCVHLKFGITIGASESIDSSDTYSKSEIKDAMKIVKNKFRMNYGGCRLTDLWYEESETKDEAEKWAKQYKADEAIVLYSNFKTGESIDDKSLNKNETYKNWTWVLVRNTGDKKWSLETWGY